MRGESVGDDEDGAVAVELMALVEERDRRALEPVFVQQCQIDVGNNDLFLVDDAFRGDSVARKVKIRGCDDRGHDQHGG